MEPGDWPHVQGIYQEGIDTGFATFESSAPDWEYFDQSRLPKHRLIDASNGSFSVGGRRRIARMTHGPLNGQWRDTLLIERRSPGI